MDLSQDSNMGPPSPSKGKGAETSSKSWRAGWWDFYPLLERPKRTLQWSPSSVIFSAHPTQPMIIGRHFSSSKQFILPTPAPVLASSTSYNPPSVLSVSPNDQWIFAYFPRNDGEGTGCLWSRGAQIDNWLLKDWWDYTKGGGVITASWLGSHREWAASASGIPMRLPTRGPPTPVSDPTLVLVTEDNCVHVTYSRVYVPGVRSIKRVLSYPGITAEVNANPDISENSSNARQCLDAAIGIGYNETTIFIATHSRRVPPPSRPTLTAPTFNSMDLSIPVDLTNSGIPDQKTIQWENYGEEPIIELFEVQLRFDGNVMALMTNYMRSLECPAPPTNLVFLCSPPAPSQSSSDSTPSTSPKRTSTEKGNIYLAVSSAEFHDYVKLPTSTLSLYSFARPNQPAGNPPRPFIWNIHKEATHTIDSGVLTHIESFVNFSTPSSLSVYASIIQHSGPIPGPITNGNASPKQAPIGTIQVFNIPDLGDQSSREPTTIMNPTNSLGRDLPLFASASPNKSLLCMLSSSHSQTQTTIHALPKSPESDTLGLREPLALAVAILGRCSTADIIHGFCSPKVPLSQATDNIYQTLEILDKHYKSEMPYPSTWDVVGIAVDIYRARSLLSKDERECETLKDRWQTGHDVCSLAACNIAFEDCKEDVGYDLEAAWEIISMCTWIVNFTEKLMKTCVLWSSCLSDTNNDQSDIFIPPILLHLAHPFALQNLVVALRHVQAFRSFIGDLPAGSENSRIAQVVLVDAIDSSGIDFQGLISILEENFDSVKKFEAPACRRALAGCQPVPVMQPYLGQLLQKISQSETVLNKSTLFIKPSDLIDGVARLSVGHQQPKNDEKDVITKGSLINDSSEICLRCGGRSAMDKKGSLSSGVSPKWAMWQLMWELRCICGGSWLSSSGGS